MSGGCRSWEPHLFSSAGLSSTLSPRALAMALFQAPEASCKPAGVSPGQRLERQVPASKAQADLRAGLVLCWLLLHGAQQVSLLGLAPDALPCVCSSTRQSRSAGSSTFELGEHPPASSMLPKESCSAGALLACCGCLVFASGFCFGGLPSGFCSGGLPSLLLEQSVRVSAAAVGTPQHPVSRPHLFLGGCWSGCCCCCCWGRLRLRAFSRQASASLAVESCSVALRSCLKACGWLIQPRASRSRASAGEAGKRTCILACSRWRSASFDAGSPVCTTDSVCSGFHSKQLACRSPPAAG